MVKILLLLPRGEDYSGLLLDPFLPCAPNPPQLIQIISYPGFVVLFSLIASCPLHNHQIVIPAGI